MKLQEFVQTKLMPPVNKMQSNIYVSSMMEGMMRMLPVTLGLSIITLAYSFPIPAWIEFIKGIGLYDLLSNAMMGANLLGVFFCMSIGYTLAGKLGITSFSGAMISIFSLLIVTPTIAEDAGNDVFTYLIDTNELGANAIITSMLVAMVSVTIFAFMVKKNFTIKFPDSVPAYVSESFSMIPPAFVTIAVFIAVRGLFGMTSFGTLTNFIYTLVQAPLSGVGNTLGGHLLLMTVATVLWWCGVHGTTVIAPVMAAVLIPSYVENMNAVLNGQPAPHVLSYITMFVIFTCLGGTGCVFGLGFDLAFFTKSERYKTQGKLSFIPCIFNISEPLMFGTPVCLNPFMFIPFVGTPIVIYLLMYAGLQLGLIATPTVLTGVYVIPGFIMGFLSGSISFGIFCIVAMILSCVIFYPFVKMMDKKALKEERGE